jgi:hypothetical protein
MMTFWLAIFILKALPITHTTMEGTGELGITDQLEHRTTGEDLTAAAVFTVVAIMANTLRKRTIWSYFYLGGLELQH